MIALRPVLRARKTLATVRQVSGYARQLQADRRGAAMLEFAIAVPAFLIMLLGVLNLGHMAYGQAVLNGAVQAASRNSSLETGDIDIADTQIRNQLRAVVPGAVITTQRKSYFDFNDIARPEKWNDTNRNGRCDNGETYTDENADGHWSADVGKSGNGSANDVVMYTVSLRYKPLFRVPFAPHAWQETTRKSTTIRKNQPFSAQEKYAKVAGACA